MRLPPGLATTYALRGSGGDFYTALTEFCRTYEVRKRDLPIFIAGFSQVEIVGTCGRLDDPQAPVCSAVRLTNMEVLGEGMIACDETEERILPHIHFAVGLKQHTATGHTSHLLSITV